MKKTLAAVLVSAFAATAANAATIYNENGTKVDLDGSLRFVLEKSNQGGVYNNQLQRPQRSHSALRNDGSRFAIKVKHTLDNGYFALARVEVRFDGKDSGAKPDQDGFGALNTKRAYVGLGNNEFGEVTIGRQVTIADDLSTANDYSYGLISKDTYIPTSGKAVIRYDYKGVKGLQVGASYQFADKRNAGEIPNDALDNGVQFAVTYEGSAAEQPNGVIAKFGYGRTNYKQSNNKSSYKNGFLASVGYEFDGVTLSLDGGYFDAKNVTANNKVSQVAFSGDSKGFYVSPGVQVQVTEKSKVYGNYFFQQEKQTENAAGVSVDEKVKTSGFLLGADYKLHKQVKTYIEGKFVESRSYANGQYNEGSKEKDKAIGVGLRVYF